MHWTFLFIFFLLLGCESPPEKEELIREVKSIVIADPSLMRSRPFPGITRAEERVNLAFRVSGPLIEIPVSVGDEVMKGEVIARIDPRDFEVSLQNAKAQLGKAKAALEFAESDFERADRIQKKDPGAISQSMVDQKREEKNRLTAEVLAAEALVDSASDQLRYALLKAPFDGRIVAKYFDNFEFIRAEQSVVRILDLTRVEMTVDIPEHLISYVSNADQVLVNLDVFPGKELEASVKEIGREASTVTRTYPVTLLLSPHDGIKILAGMSGEARFKGDLGEDSKQLAMIIPAQSIFTDTGNKKTYVFVIEPKTSQTIKREVELGYLTSEGVQILSGLKPGERIATAGVNYLKDQQKVRVPVE